MKIDQKSFIEEIRSLNEPTKRKIMLGATVIIMVLVIYLWLAYFNTIVPNAVPAVAPQSPSPSIASSSDEGGPGIMGMFVDGASSFWQSVVGGARDMAGVIRNSKQYDINPK